MNMIKSFLKDEEGMSMVEYALIGALIVAVGAAVLTNIGTSVQGALNDVQAQF